MYNSLEEYYSQRTDSPTKEVRRYLIKYQHSKSLMAIAYAYYSQEIDIVITYYTCFFKAEHDSDFAYKRVAATINYAADNIENPVAQDYYSQGIALTAPKSHKHWSTITSEEKRNREREAKRRYYYKKKASMTPEELEAYRQYHRERIKEYRSRKRGDSND